MMAFRSRKRKAGAPRETQAKTPPADAAATTPTGSPTKHPVAAFANTVYVDPVIKVRRRARSRPRIARAIESARLSRLTRRTDSRRKTKRVAFSRRARLGADQKPHPSSSTSHLQSVYRYVDKKTFLNWGLTSDWLVEGPRKRRASGGAATPTSPPTPQKPERGGSTAECLAKAPESDEDEDPNASSEGYGEMTEGSIERLLVFLRTLGSHPEVERLAARKNGAEKTKKSRRVARGVSARNDHLSELDLTSSSSFIDVGSGYGKVVLHARLSARVAEAAGIEYVASRADMAADALRELRSGKHAFVTPEALALLRDARATRLTKGDATKLGAFQFSHVYMYDKVFSDPTTALLAAQLNASEKTKVLVSYQRAEQWRRLGLDARFVEVASLTMRTTGGQNFKAYVFVRAG
jgi:hypothetical protein